MKWTKHDTDAHQDAKLQNVLLDYGLEGYGLYWYCIELIAGKVSVDNITFELEHDARILARNTGSTAQKIQEMMKYFVELGLFECSNNTITCMKLAKRLDKSMTGNPVMRKVIETVKSHDSVMQDKNRLDKNRLDNKEPLSGKPDSADVIKYLNSVLGTKYRASTKAHSENINARLAEGHTFEDLKLVVDYKNAEWSKDQKMAQYLRPQTLFQAGKFQGYLTAAKTKEVKTTSLHNLDGITYEGGDL